MEFGRHIADLVADFHGGGWFRLGCRRGLSGLSRLRGGLLHRDGLGRGSGLRGRRDGGLRRGIGRRRRGLCLGLLHHDGLGRSGGLRGLHCGCRWLRGGIGGRRWLCLGLLHRDGLGRSGGLRGLGRRWLWCRIDCGRRNGLLQRDGWLRRGRGGGLRGLRLLNDGRRLYRLLRLGLRGRGDGGGLLRGRPGDLRGGCGAACGKRAEQGGYRKRGYEGVP